jgi:hypothetical protein
MRRSHRSAFPPLACASLLASCGTAAISRDQTRQPIGPTLAPKTQRVAASQPSLTAAGTSSTPGIFRLPQMGFVGFRCDRAFRVQPLFDTYGTTAEEQVTIQAPNVRRRNFTTQVIGRYRGKPLRQTTYSPQLVTVLPFAHYSSVTFTVSTGTEARALTAEVTAQFVAGIFKRKGYPPLGACYVKHWLVSMTVSPN